MSAVNNPLNATQCKRGTTQWFVSSLKAKRSFSEAAGSIAHIHKSYSKHTRLLLPETDCEMIFED